MARDQRDNEESDCVAASTFAESYIRHTGMNKKKLRLKFKKYFRQSGQSLRSTT